MTSAAVPAQKISTGGRPIPDATSLDHSMDIFVFVWVYRELCQLQDRSMPDILLEWQVCIQSFRKEGKKEVFQGARGPRRTHVRLDLVLDQVFQRGQELNCLLQGALYLQGVVNDRVTTPSHRFSN